MASPAGTLHRKHWAGTDNRSYQHRGELSSVWLYLSLMISYSHVRPRYTAVEELQDPLLGPLASLSGLEMLCVPRHVGPMQKRAHCLYTCQHSLAGTIAHG